MSAFKKNIKGFCIAGTHSGCGKTTVSLGVMSALMRRGYAVQAFKVGPDFIDPGHHRRITGRDSHNLDSWIMDQRQNREIFSRYTQDSDMVVLEGVMGLFDGSSGIGESGSTAQMAKWLNLPVLLVIDARSMARSAAAVALGYTRFDDTLPIQGIIINRVGSENHEQMLREAIDFSLDLPVYGCLPKNTAIDMPSRHLGLFTDEDHGMTQNQIEELARWVENHLDLDQLLSSLEEKSVNECSNHSTRTPDIRIGIAQDEAFCFYYPENLRLLREAGAELLPFSPLRSQDLPEGIMGLILGGGYPELYCRDLSGNTRLLEALRKFAAKGGVIYAECGGFMYLMKQIVDLNGGVHPMVNLFPFSAKMALTRKSLGYREIVTQKNSILGPAGTRVRGHEFHYSYIEGIIKDAEAVFSVRDRKRLSQDDEGFTLERVLGSYVHLHWGSNPDVARHFVNYCRMNGP